jgi:hypothetical protein
MTPKISERPEPKRNKIMPKEMPFNMLNTNRSNSVSDLPLQIILPPILRRPLGQVAFCDGREGRTGCRLGYSAVN